MDRRLAAEKKSSVRCIDGLLQSLAVEDKVDVGEELVHALHTSCWCRGPAHAFVAQ
jgi:hypothetical protein